jgi:hypothetical protein
MELAIALFLTLAVALLAALFITRPLSSRRAATEKLVRPAAEEAEIQRSSLLAERDRVLTALQDLEFDHTLGKIPDEEYPRQRADLLVAGAEALRQLDALSGQEVAASAEDRVEAAVAARRADAAVRQPSPAEDEIEAQVAAHRRARQEKAGGFCPKCGRPVTKSDRFCSRCGAAL